MTERKSAAGILALMLLPLAGCADFPELDRKVDPAVLTAPYPMLLPLEAVTPPPPPPTTVVPDLTAQGAALTARAQAQNSLP
jgi:hypothetical protein